MNRKEMLARLKKSEAPLEVSILKWVDIAKGKDMEIYGPRNCALCEIHFHPICGGCPIAEKTQNGLCENTPYDDYEEAYDNEESDEVLRKLALEEVEFLKSLRKET